MGTKAGSGNNLDTNLPLSLKNQRKMKAVLFVLLVVTMATIIHGMAVSFDDAFRRSKLYFRCMRDCNTDRSECKTECLNKPENFSGCSHCREKHDYCTGDKREFQGILRNYKRGPVNPKACHQHYDDVSWGTTFRFSIQTYF